MRLGYHLRAREPSRPRLATAQSAVGYFDDAYEINRIDYGYECAASVTCAGTVMVVHYPELREVWTVEFGCGDE